MVAAYTAKTAPKPMQMEPLSLDTYRLSYWYSVCQAVGFEAMPNAGLLKRLQVALNSMKVTFVLCGSAEDAEKRRWEYSSSLQALAEARVLRGWKKILGIVSLKANLKGWAKPYADLDDTRLYCAIIFMSCLVCRWSCSTHQGLEVAGQAGGGCPARIREGHVSGV